MDDSMVEKIVKCQANVRKFLNQKNQGLTSRCLLSLSCHQKLKLPPTQLDFYKRNHASKQIIPYVTLQGKTFGEKYMETIAREFFNLDPRTSSTHDHTKLGKSIEQKSARYHANGSDWKWQHIEMSHEWNYLLLCGLDFRDIKFYICSRKVVEDLINEGIITGQGKKNKEGVAQPQQAYWFSRTDFKRKNKIFTDYFTQIKNEKDLIRFIQAK